jgi:SagB-type dehydrogenase family enzyme
MSTQPARRLDPELAAAPNANAFKPFDPWVRSTGFRTHGLRHRALSHAADARVAEEFLLNTRHRRDDRETEMSIEAYFTGPYTAILAELDQDESAGLDELPLPDGVRLRLELGHALARRASGRVYTGDPIELSYIATVVRSAAAITRTARVQSQFDGQERTLRFRSAPSGGGLYPIDLYLGALSVTGLPEGVYRYRPHRDSLLRVGGETTLQRVMRCFNVYEGVITLTRADAVALLVARPWRSMRKYGPRGLRYLFLEAGAISQNIHLATQALGFASVDCASVVDDELHEAMDLDGLHQALVHSIVIGYAG